MSNKQDGFLFSCITDSKDAFPWQCCDKATWLFFKTVFWVSPYGCKVVVSTLISIYIQSRKKEREMKEERKTVSNADGIYPFYRESRCVSRRPLADPACLLALLPHVARLRHVTDPSTAPGINRSPSTSTVDVQESSFLNRPVWLSAQSPPLCSSLAATLSKEPSTAVWVR